jgi:Fe2+ transport system protein FeoA
MTTQQEGLLTLTEMRTGQAGTVAEILGGHGFVRRLETLGIRPGKKVTKVSSRCFMARSLSRSIRLKWPLVSAWPRRYWSG